MEFIKLTDKLLSLKDIEVIVDFFRDILEPYCVRLLVWVLGIFALNCRNTTICQIEIFL